MKASDEKPRKRRGLRARIVLLTMAGTLGPVAVLGWLSWSSLGALERQVLEERQQLAISLAAHVDSAINSELALLESVPASQSPGGAQFEQAALREAYVRSRFLSRVFLVGPEGTIVQVGLSGPGLGGLPTSLPGFREALGKGAPEISPLWNGPGGAHRLFLLVPARNTQNQVISVIGGEIDPEGPGFASLLGFVPLPAHETVDLVDQHGIVIASTTAGRLYTESDHGHYLSSLIEHRMPTAGTCHGCHQTGLVSQRVDEVMAFAPLPSRGSWGISILQPKTQAFSTVAALRWKILTLAPALALLSLGFALGAASSITGPLSVLAGTAEQIAAGELKTPVPDVGSDEVGHLGRALDRMRGALRQSLDEIARGRDQLQLRVQERTAQIEHLYEELKQRDLLRVRLLQKLIGAQEDERRRIARELHDETSQVMTSLALSLDTAIATLPEGAPRTRLQDAKSLVLRSLDGIHHLSFDLRPSALDDLGLFRAIEWYAERDLEQRGIAVRCESDQERARLAPETEIALFRAAQEAITNIVKHARAETVLIQCSATPKAVTIEIEDDGQGFDPASISDTATSGRGLGLAGIRERMEILGGSALIDSAPGRGTRLVLTAPQDGDHG